MFTSFKENPETDSKNFQYLQEEDNYNENRSKILKHELTKRRSYLDWDEYFMSIAFLAAMRSKDPCTQVGACIINEDKIIVGVGYNGFPWGCSDDEFPWTKSDPNQSKHLYVCHAELNAFMNNNAKSLKNCSIYVGLFPCNECAKVIVLSGIKEVVYISDKHAHKVTTIAAKNMFDINKVEYRQYIPKQEIVEIDFSKIDCKNLNQSPVLQPKLSNQNLMINLIDGKRTNYLDWDEYFMSVAFLAAMRSKDPCTQVGACIVDENKIIVGVGYNGFPWGCSDDEFPWSKNNPNESKHLYVCHAELNAFVNKNVKSLKNCSIYVGLFPCNECAKVIVLSGIKKVFYISDKHAHKDTTKAAKKMFDANKIEYSKYTPKQEKIVIDFSKIDWNNMSQLPPTPAKNDFHLLLSDTLMDQNVKKSNDNFFINNSIPRTQLRHLDTSIQKNVIELTTNLNPKLESFKLEDYSKISEDECNNDFGLNKLEITNYSIKHPQRLPYVCQPEARSTSKNSR